MTIKVPLIFESTFSFLKGLNDIHPDAKLEAFSILARAYRFSPEQAQGVREVAGAELSGRS